MAEQVIHQILSDPKYSGYVVEFSPGDVLCTEGEVSQDLCILFSGVLEVFKAGEKIKEIDQPGSVIGVHPLINFGH